MEEDEDRRRREERDQEDERVGSLAVKYGGLGIGGNDEELLIEDEEEGEGEAEIGAGKAKEFLVVGTILTDKVIRFRFFRDSWLIYGIRANEFLYMRLVNGGIRLNFSILLI
ncbi:unnamed protein product [Cuscuta epithymum]|uniref:Uncharacterized protein n=1 Tax=Cuscuta epithymum TaxID=186058 RepID=A0AAV0CPS7_9ASTE|nr:unnamed protein product [Cuscuta epithymum]